MARQAEPFLHDPHSLRRILARERKRIVRRARQPRLEFFLACQQDRHALVIDRGDQRVRRGRQK